MIYHLHYASLVDNLVQLRFKNAWCVASGASDSDVFMYLFQNRFFSRMILVAKGDFEVVVGRSCYPELVL